MEKLFSNTPYLVESPHGGGPRSPEADADAKDKANSDMEARFGQAREEDMAKRDRVLNRLQDAKNPEDVAAALEIIIDYEDPQFAESIDRYTFGAYKRAAVEGRRAFEKGSKGELRSDPEETKNFADKITEELKAQTKKDNLIRIVREDKGNLICDVVENRGSMDPKKPETVAGSYDIGVTYELRKKGIVTKNALINSRGDLVKGDVRAAGYAISVEENGGMTKEIVQSVEWAIDPQTLQKDPKNSKIVEREEQRRSQDVKIHFGTETERLAMAKAHDALHKCLISAELLQGQTQLFDKDRAALELAVKEFYQYQEYFTNQQHKDFWTAPDISIMDASKPETLNNQEFGRRKSLSIRMYYLLGHCETKEKMEDHLNNTKNLEAILTKDNVTRILQIAKDQKSPILSGLLLDTDEQKHDAAARFLIGAGLKIDRSRTDHQPQYTVDWFTAAERDPLGVSKKHNRHNDEEEWKYENEVKKKGAGAVKEEKDKRGYLTIEGNPYAKASRDSLYLLMKRMNRVVGDDMAVTEAGRYFWTRGMRDEYGLELYTDEKNFPTGEELQDYVNSNTDEERTIYFKDLQRLVTLNGEPVGSDLSKIIHTKWWRFKEMIRDRSAGSYLTWDKFDHVTLSFMRLIRTSVEVPGKNFEGKTLKETRSLEEQFLGFRSKDGKADEEPKEMGEIEWEKVATPKETKEAVSLSGLGVTDNADAYWWVMNYLTADDAGGEGAGKRLYQMLMKGVERPQDLEVPKSWTDKIKFWVITQHDAVAIGGQWRGWYAEHSKGDPDKAEFLAGRKAQNDINIGRKKWWEGVRSSPEYQTWQELKAAFLLYTKETGRTGGTLTVIQALEGKDRSKPGPAVKFGFLDAEQINQPPAHPLIFFRS